MNTGDRWGRVRDLFERALDEQPEALDVWLEREAGGDAQLRAEVRSLIEHHAKAGSFLVEPAGNGMPDPLADDRALEPGRVLGPYTVVREVGRGGMGRVYLATDARLGRHVALKALAPELTAHSTYRDRLRREARAAAALTHPGICTVYALEELEGDLFIASEYIEGRTLREEIRSGRRPTAVEIVRDARSLAAALAHAHRSGITHRDLKPDNVMRTRDGRLKILDFGLAHIDTSDPDAADGRLTEPGAIMGTPRYMAPEQLNGQPADMRADVFGFGMLLYEYACGAHPFDASTPLGVAARILEGEATPIDEWRSDVPAPVARAIARCLRKSPADRFASAAEIERALDSVEPARPIRPMVVWWRLHQLVVVALYFSACALAWQVKEWRPGVPTVILVVVASAATAAGVVRGHLVFTERMNGPGLAAERGRAGPITLLVDLLLAMALAADGVLLLASRPLVAVLTIGLGIGIALVRLVVEPATTSASFPR